MAKGNYKKWCSECNEFKPCYGKTSKKCTDCVDKSIESRKNRKVEPSKRGSHFKRVFGMTYEEHKRELDKQKQATIERFI